MTTRKNPIGLIAAPDHVIHAMVDRLAKSPTSSQRVWPFRFMQVGDAVVFRADRGVAVTIVAHVYTQKRKAIKFQAQRATDGTMRIERIR